MYSGEYDVYDVTLSVYPLRASFKCMPRHGGNRTYDLWNTSPIILLDDIGIEGTRFSSEISLTQNRPDRVAQLAEHWASFPKVVIIICPDYKSLI